MSQSVNNFFESLCNSSNPRYAGVSYGGYGLTSGDNAGVIMNSYTPPSPTTTQIWDRNIANWNAWMPQPPSNYSFDYDSTKY